MVPDITAVPWTIKCTDNPSCFPEQARQTFSLIGEQTYRLQWQVQDDKQKVWEVALFPLTMDGTVLSSAGAEATFDGAADGHRYDVEIRIEQVSSSPELWRIAGRSNDLPAGSAPAASGGDRWGAGQLVGQWGAEALPFLPAPYITPHRGEHQKGERSAEPAPGVG